MAGLIRSLLGGGRGGRGGRGGGGGGLFGRRRRTRRGGGGGGYSGGGGGGGYSGGGGRYIDNMQSMGASDGMQYGGGMSSSPCGPGGCGRPAGMPYAGSYPGNQIIGGAPSMPTVATTQMPSSPAAVSTQSTAQRQMAMGGMRSDLYVKPTYGHSAAPPLPGPDFGISLPAGPPATAGAVQQPQGPAASPDPYADHQQLADSLMADAAAAQRVADTGFLANGRPANPTQIDWHAALAQKLQGEARAAKLAIATMRREDSSRPPADQQRHALQTAAAYSDARLRRALVDLDAAKLASDPDEQERARERIARGPGSVQDRASRIEFSFRPGDENAGKAWDVRPERAAERHQHELRVRGADFATHAIRFGEGPPETTPAWRHFYERYSTPYTTMDGPGGNKVVTASWLDRHKNARGPNTLRLMQDDAHRVFGVPLYERQREERLAKNGGKPLDRNIEMQLYNDAMVTAGQYAARLHDAWTGKTQLGRTQPQGDGAPQQTAAPAAGTAPAAPPVRQIWSVR